MKKIIVILFAAFIPIFHFAQVPVGAWRDHYAYTQGMFVAIAPDKVYVASPNGVFWYMPSQGSLGKITTANGLSDIGVSAIGYSPFQDLLAVGYENGNIDLVFKEQVINLPFVMQKPMQGSKQINHFYFDEFQNIYVATGFGIVVVNIDKREIKDTYFIGPGGTELWVNQVIVYNNRIYAATKSGLLSAASNDPLLIHYASWFYEQSIPSSDYNSLAVFNNNLIVNQATGSLIPDVVWYFDSFAWNQLTTEFNEVRNLWADDSKLAISSREGIGVFQSVPGLINTISSYSGDLSFNPNYVALDNEGNLVVGDNSLGLMYYQNQNWTQIHPNAPYNDNTYFVLPTDQELYVLGGARTDIWSNRYFPLTLHSLANNHWATIIDFDYFDAVRITPSPFYPNEYYISSWGNGIVVYRDGQVVENYNPTNSSLETILPGAYCRIGGVAFDSQGNLWASNAGVTNPISMRTPDGTWTGFPYQGVINSQRQSDIILSPNGYLWVVLPSGGGLFVLDPGDNPTSISSHSTRRFKPTDSDGASLPNDISSLAFDKDGYLWVGTNEGVLVSYNPQRVLEPSAFNFQQVKIPDVVPGLAVYLLETETVTTIAVDGGNRKWFGTQRSGVFLQSADGSNQLLHFTKENSPLPSNTIQHIGIHPKSGEVFFATDKGMVSYRGDATEPVSKFGKIYAFPNPVRPNYNGLITITGLVDKTIVKITDVAGNLVYETQSLGGSATWDGKNLNGRKVSTGVYLFFCADINGEQSAVGKILFVK
jgi:ligand-binding sensor domain-containing protein